MNMAWGLILGSVYGDRIGGTHAWCWWGLDALCQALDKPRIPAPTCLPSTVPHHHLHGQHHPRRASVHAGALCLHGRGLHVSLHPWLFDALPILMGP